MLLQIPRHHFIRDPEFDFAILIVETHTNGSETPPSINCHSRSCIGEITTNPGLIIGHAKLYLLVTRVSPGVIVETTGSGHAGVSRTCRHFMIGSGFELIRITSEKHLFSGDEQETHEKQFGSAPFAGVHLRDNDLTSLFSNTDLPIWVRSALDSQLDWWNSHHIENYYRHTLGQPIGSEFGRCIKATPFWALARWKQNLFPDQRNFCMRRSPAAAVAFCMDSIPQARRLQMLTRAPWAALRYAFAQLDEKEVAMCVDAAPSMALTAARELTPTSRALLLAIMIKHCMLWSLNRPPTLEAEIFDSITEAPESWLANFGNSFITAFEKMDQNLGICPSGETLISLSQRLPSDKQARLLEVVASWI